MRLLLLFLLLVVISCRTMPKPVDLGPEWPAPPDPAGNVFLLKEPREVPAGVIVMRLEYWLALVDYIVAAEEVRKAYRGLHVDY